MAIWKFILKRVGLPATIDRLAALGLPTRVGESPSWLRHRILIPAFEGSSPSSPAKFLLAVKRVVNKINAVTRIGPSFDLAEKFMLSTITHSSSDFMVFTGNANPVLAAEVAYELDISLGLADVGRFSDGEVRVELKQNVRARDVFVIQSTCSPTNENLMELLIMVDALKRASAGRISAIIPYFGYARQDRRPRSTRVPITAKVLANMLQAVGVNHVLTMDLHADQIQGFFDIPVDNIYASPVLLGDLVQKNYEDLIVVSPDVGGVVRARALAKQLNCDLAIIDKRRPQANVSEVMHVIGEIDGRNCVIMDDMIDTAGTLVKAAEVLKARGAKKVYAYCTHPIFSGPAIDRIAKGNALDEVVVTNTIPLSQAAAACPKIRQLTVAPLLAKTIQRIANGESVMSLFSDQD